jgi:hypothetical protein
MKQYRVFNTEEDVEIHEYNITVDINDNNHEEITLYRSRGETWSGHVRGEERIKIIDTGNMMVFPKKMFSGDVAYDEFAELFIITSFINKTSPGYVYKGRIEEITNQSFDI